MAEEDIIFGKNRHFFGGLEPSNMTAFDLYIENGEVKVNAQLPGDTVIDGQTLCSIGGAVIRRKTTDYPRDEFDGDLVFDVKSSGLYKDLTADPTGTYYYRAFPYTTKGVYNRNLVSKAVINEPEPMVAFSAKSVYNASTDSASVQLTVDMPDSAVGVVIRKSNMGYPVNENDGDAVMTVTSDGVYTDADVIVGITYYYSAFPYTSNGGYSRSETNRASVSVINRTYIFGYDLDTNDSNPSTRVTYPEDVDNVNYTPAAMNYSSSTFNYGSWPSAAGEKFMPRPCMLNSNGTVAHYLNPNNYGYQEDGVTASSVRDTSFDGNAMMEWPKIYTKRWEDEHGIYHFRCSDVKIASDWDCWCNYDKNNNEIDHFYTAIYFGSLISNKLRSIAGGTNNVSKTADAEITYAKANGDDWYTEVLADRLLITDLLVMMAKTTDCQTAYGKGYCKNSSAYNNHGAWDTKGMFYGYNNQTSPIKVFGMEHWWGNIWRRIAGWINDNGTQKVKLTRGTHDGSTATDYNTDGSGYISVSGATPAGTSSGYISDMKTEAFGRIPYTASGSSSTYEADGLYYNNSGTMYAFVGGSWDGDLHVGPFCAHLYYATSTAIGDLGAALSCKPSAT